LHAAPKGKVGDGQLDCSVSFSENSRPRFHGRQAGASVGADIPLMVAAFGERFKRRSAFRVHEQLI
jgi:hypothetical protein